MNDEQHVAGDLAPQAMTRPGELVRDYERFGLDDEAGRVAEGEVSALARRRDPSLTNPAPARARRGTLPGSGVVWVRPTDLLATRSGRMAGRGIDFQAELARRTRRLPRRAVRAGVRAVSDRGRRLPSVSAFGRHGGERVSGVARPGIGPV